MYVIVKISGKQFKVTEGAKLRVPKQSVDTGKKVNFDNVLLVQDEKDTKIGKPSVAGASVTAMVLEHGRERKILVYKKKRRKGYQRKNGHRQGDTNIEIQKIKLSAAKKKAAPKKPKPEAKTTVRKEK